MSFFVPRGLIELEYLVSDEEEEDSEEEQGYERERDLAFFVANFGYTKEDYNQLTPKEKAFIYKAYERKLVLESSIASNGVGIAVRNVLRRDGEPYIQLWEKKNKQIENIEEIMNAVEVVLEMEERDGKDWVKALYRE